MSIWDNSTGILAAEPSTQQKKLFQSSSRAASEIGSIHTTMTHDTIYSNNTDAPKDEFGQSIKLNMLYNEADETAETSFAEPEPQADFRGLRLDRTLFKGQRKVGYKGTPVSMCCDEPGALCCFSRLQGPLQAWCRPAVACGFARKSHSYSERWWIPDAGPDIAYMHLLNMLRTMKRSGINIIYQANKDKHNIIVHSYSEFDALDVIEFTIQHAASVNESDVDVNGFSTGYVSPAVPLAPCFNWLLSCVPFTDRGRNEDFVFSLRRELESTLVIRVKR